LLVATTELAALRGQRRLVPMGNVGPRNTTYATMRENREGALVMRALKVALPILLALAFVLVVSAPIGPMPGLWIGGTSANPPVKWSDTSDVDEIILKVPGLLPRVVIIWVVEYGGELHVVGGAESGWVKMIGSGSPVEMRLGDSTYSLRASPVAEGWQQILEAYAAKYQPKYPDIVAGLPSIEEAADRVTVFRLDRSQGGAEE
jgi:hypothetical protein